MLLVMFYHELGWVEFCRYSIVQLLRNYKAKLKSYYSASKTIVFQPIRLFYIKKGKQHGPEPYHDRQLHHSG